MDKMCIACFSKTSEPQCCPECENAKEAPQQAQTIIEYLYEVEGEQQ